MIENASRQLLFVAVLALLSVLSVTSYEFNLGLDLEGGTQLIYDVDVDQAKKDGLIDEQASEADVSVIIDETAAIIEDRADPTSTRDISVVRRGETGILVELPKVSAEEAAAIERRITTLGTLEMRIVLEMSETFSEDGVSFDVPDERRRLQEWLDKDDGANRKLVADDPAKISLFHALTTADGGRASAFVQWFPHRVNPHLTLPDQWGRSDSRANAQSVVVPAFDDAAWNGGLIPEDMKAGGEGTVAPFLVEFFPINIKEEYFEGQDLDPSGIQAGLDDDGTPCLLYSLKTSKRDAYADWSEKYIGKRSAIILNGYVHSAPVFQSRIPGSGRISGGFTRPQVDNLIKVLRTGSLQVRPILQSKFTVGATLGQKSIDLGMLSIGIGGACVLAFILFYYRLSGLVAFVAIGLNILLIFGAMQFLRATLTLPGIAGLVLTMGMAVDANILIYERIREELTKGKELLQAVRVGFERAMVTILDANITTFIAGLVLYLAGVGPIRGFAVTLMIGIVTSVFTAFFVSRLMFHYLLESKKLTEFAAVGWFANLKFDFLKHARKALTISALVIVGGITAIVSIPSDTTLGLDFTGGANLQIVLKEAMTPDDVRSRLEADEQFVGRFQRPFVNTVGEVTDGRASKFAIKVKLTDAVRTEMDTAQRAAKAVGEDYEPPYISDLRRVFGESLVDEAFSEPNLFENPENPAIQYAEIVLHFQEPVTFALVQQRIGERFANVAARGFGPDKDAQGEARNVKVEFDADSTVRAEALFPAVQEALGQVEADDGHVIALSDPIPESEEIGGRMVSELRNSAIGSLLIALFLIVMFIRLRFQQYKYGFAAVAALVHDVLVTLGFVVLANALGIVEAELNLAMIAAFLTIIGYSINDTIVIFDRVRENLNEQARLGEQSTFHNILNRSINQTLSRTILTTTTTFFVVLVQFVVNYGQGSALEGFSFALLIGLLSGTYSTIFVASPVVDWLRKREQAQASAGGTTDSGAEKPESTPVPA